MEMLRYIADSGCTVVVVTHGTEQLGMADRVLAIAEGGRPAYFGSPGGLLPALDSATHADLMNQLTGSEAAEDYATGRAAQDAAELAAEVAETAGARTAARARYLRTRQRRQLPVLIRRQLAVVRARGPLAIGAMFAIPAGFAGLAGTITHPSGLAMPGPTAQPTAAPTLGLLVTICMLTGQALTYSDVVSEFGVIQREHRTGTSPAAVIVSKVLVFGTVSLAQAALVVAVYLTTRPGPDYTVLLQPTVELFVDLAGVSFASMALGLLVSVCARTIERAVALATTAVVSQVALNGISFGLSASPLAVQLPAALLPTRWGLAAAAATIDLARLSPLSPRDALWQHTLTQWCFDLGALATLCAIFVCLAWSLLRHRLARPDHRG
jgi:hypothetical protein